MWRLTARRSGAVLFLTLHDAKARQLRRAFATDTALVLGISRSTKSHNEIPAVQKLREELDVAGLSHAADALPKKTFETADRSAGASDRSIKDNQLTCAASRSVANDTKPLRR